MTLSPEFHTVSIAGVDEALPLIALNDAIAIALLMVIDRGVRFGARIGAALADIARPHQPDIVVGPATLGIPVAIEVTRALGLDDYVILQKSPKIHLADALRESVTSVTSHGVQTLMLDRRAVPLLEGRRVFVVDDVASTGSSLAAMLRLLRRAGAEIVGIGTILTEGHDWEAALGADAALLKALGHIPVFRIENGVAVAIPETL
ncbi:phosphoribosyltransferase family protein [Acidisoma silvae]|uniref:Phosphoribosyltransferase n=1 Tax=Acidisoma silvae TaxID=2802396 RepID=A0A963YR34_9PROT|nr:phosphoribosyltransferase family protein [Acidisoma silvae]MCB8875286.1 phosphoribosyltransferase [Acidisoma silvae]